MLPYVMHGGFCSGRPPIIVLKMTWAGIRKYFSVTYFLLVLQILPDFIQYKMKGFFRNFVVKNLIFCSLRDV